MCLSRHALQVALDWRTTRQNLHLQGGLPHAVLRFILFPSVIAKTVLHGPSYPNNLAMLPTSCASFGGRPLLKQLAKIPKRLRKSRHLVLSVVGILNLHTIWCSRRAYVLRVLRSSYSVGANAQVQSIDPCRCWETILHNESVRICP